MLLHVDAAVVSFFADHALITLSLYPHSFKSKLLSINKKSMFRWKHATSEQWKKLIKSKSFHLLSTTLMREPVGSAHSLFLIEKDASTQDVFPNANNMLVLREQVMAIFWVETE